MACFVVPAVEAVITTAVTKAVKSNEREQEIKISLGNGVVEEGHRVKFSTKLGWLNKMLWGGSALLAFEHAWHGEIVPFFPFFTAVDNGNTAQMLAEMGTAGVMMSVIVTGVWAVMLGVSNAMEKKAVNEAKAVEEGV